MASSHVFLSISESNFKGLCYGNSWEY